MRKIIAFEHVTLDSLFAGPNGEIDWALRDKEIAEYTQSGKNTVGAFMFGRVTYDMMARFWPTPAGEAADPVYAKSLNESPKFVFSKKIKKADWNNTTVIHELNKEEVMKIKQSPGKDIMIFGSGMVVDQLLNLGLLDECHLLVNPVILGVGKPLFKNITGKLSMKLMATKAFKNGVVFLRYQKV